MEMSNTEAMQALKDGGTLLLLGMPKGTEFGIDLNTWKTGPKFRGVKMIPVGLHFIYFSAVSKEGAVAPRTGFFHFFTKGEFLIRRYDPRAENVVDYTENQQEIDAARANIQELDRFLGAYPRDNYKRWFSLTNLISEKVVEKLNPLSGLICSASELITVEADKDEEAKPTGRKQPQDLLPNMVFRPGTEIRFSEIPSKKYPEGSTPQEITRHNLDSSYVLNQLLEKHANKEDFLGEVQFAFVCFLVGQVFDAFEQWKKLVHIMSSSEQALLDYQDFFLSFISILYYEVNEVPPDMFVDIVESTNFLTVTLNLLFSNISDAPLTLDGQLRQRANKFRRYLTKRFKWNFFTENEEDAPVVVEDV